MLQWLLVLETGNPDLDDLETVMLAAGEGYKETETNMQTSGRRRFMTEFKMSIRREWFRWDGEDRPYGQGKSVLNVTLGLLRDRANRKYGRGWREMLEIARPDGLGW